MVHGPLNLAGISDARCSPRSGISGTCLALELAFRGVDVDLYDRNDPCITQAHLAVAPAFPLLELMY
jgi:hypothetical protein